MSTVPEHIMRIAGFTRIDLQPQIKRALNHIQEDTWRKQQELMNLREDGVYGRMLAGGLAREIDLETILEWECVADILDVLNKEKAMCVESAGTFLREHQILSGPQPKGFFLINDQNRIDEGKDSVLHSIAEAATHATMFPYRKKLCQREMWQESIGLHRKLVQRLTEYVGGTIPQFA